MTKPKINTKNMTDTCPCCDGTGKHKSDTPARMNWMRKQSGMKQVDFAKSIGLTRTTLANIEAGRQSLPQETIINICKSTGVSADWLLGI